MGYIAVDGIAGSEIIVCSLDGHVLYNGRMHGSHAEIPVPAGIYVVAHQSKTITSRLVHIN